jgi:1-acyl-sn-glycerol-3-phosphate acyltransferase
VAACAVVLVRRLTRSPRPALALARAWARLCLWLTGCRVHVSGLEVLQPGRRVVLMASHRSALDIPALLAALPVEQDVVFWSKQSLFRVPLLGQAMRALDFLAVDREHRLRAAPMLATTLELVRQGRSPLVFPEETYGPGGGELLPLQRGAFLLAIRAGLPIVPVGISGTARALPPETRLVRPTVVEVHLGEPIPVVPGQVSARRRLEAATRTALLSLGAGR